MTLREVLAAQARFVTISLDDADAYLANKARFDPSFKPFVEAAEACGANVTILSSGVEPLIQRALQRNGVAHVRALANDVRVSAGGWEMLFRDASDNGHDKRAHVLAAANAGDSTVYIGDGFSDYDAAVAADRRFAKRGRALETYLRERGIPFTPFTHFDEVQRALFGSPLS